MSVITRTTRPLGIVAAATLLAAAAGPAAAAQSATKPAPKPNQAATSYVAVTKAGALQVVDRRSGKILRTIAQAPRGTSYVDGAIAPDGTVWAVRQGKRFTDTALYKITGGHAYLFSQYARTVRVSPDGARIAYSVISPDVDRDGYGAQSLRIANTQGPAQVKSVINTRIPMDWRSGEPMVQVEEMRVSTWLDNDRVAVATACCDYGAVTIVNRTWPTRDMHKLSWRSSSRVLRPVAKEGNTFLAPIERSVKGRDGYWRTVALDIYRFSAAKPLGVKVASVNAPSNDETQLRRWVAQRPALVPLDDTVKRLPYAGRSLDHQFLG